MNNSSVDFLEIDGADGEGGGQILRSSLTLSMLTGRSIRISRVRAGRKRPGLLRQHLAAVEAAVQVSAATCCGAELGSRRLEFMPGPIQPGHVHCAIGTAGSATLVLQTILPVLAIADAPSTITLEGGTHNPWAPPYDFLTRAYLPQLERMGPTIVARLDRAGFYPAGGGRFAVDVIPATTLQGFDLLDRGLLRRQSITALVANLPASIGRREVDTAVRRLGWTRAATYVNDVDSTGPGNCVFAELEFERVTEIVTGFGRLGVPAERVAAEVVREVREFEKSSAAVGQHLADQLMLPLAISAWQNQGRSPGGRFRTLPLTQHSRTQIAVIRKFLDVDLDVVEEDEGTCIVRIQSNQ